MVVFWYPCDCFYLVIKLSTLLSPIYFEQKLDETISPFLLEFQQVIGLQNEMD